MASEQTKPIPKRITIKDVAKAAEVDISTVSRVINGKRSISPETSVRVQRAIRQLGYRPNHAARAMVTQKTRTVALLVPNLSDPNIALIADGAEHEARRQGYSLLLSGYQVHAAEGGIDDFFDEHKVDGLVLRSPRHLGKAHLDLPCVTLEEVAVDNERGGQLVAEHLMSLGHQRVAYLGGPDNSPGNRRRLRGFEQAFQGEALVRLGDWTDTCGYKLTHDLLERNADMSAIFAASDAVALGVIHALHEHGLAIPADMSVVGFDDIAAAQHYWPPLTTVKQPFAELGRTAIDLLLARIEGAPEPTSLSFPVDLIKRASSGPRRA